VNAPEALPDYSARNIHEEPRNPVQPTEKIPRGGDGEREISFFRDIALPLGTQVVAIVFEIYLLDKIFGNNKS
jgi:hypothetical protein